MDTLQFDCDGSLYNNKIARCGAGNTNLTPWLAGSNDALPDPITQRVCLWHFTLFSVAVKSPLHFCPSWSRHQSPQWHLPLLLLLLPLLVLLLLVVVLLVAILQLKVEAEAEAKVMPRPLYPACQ